MGCDGTNSSNSIPRKKFQSTHPRGVRHPTTIAMVAMIVFQSTHPRGVRRRARAPDQGNGDFNPRTHVGCDIRPDETAAHAKDFNPRTHVGCDLVQGAEFQPDKISIHAPTWGATPHGADGGLELVISIHAPTWGATYVSFRSFLMVRFQSTHPRGVRHEANRKVLDYIKFQSTHPRGVRPALRLFNVQLRNFNPRTHVGCDLQFRGHRELDDISIHAPTWGATRSRTARIRG